MRDVSKVLSDAEVIKLRQMLSGLPEGSGESQGFEEYPKMLFHKEWYSCYRLVKDHPDPLVQKEAKNRIKKYEIIVHNIEEEEDYLADGWIRDPNDLVIQANIEEGRPTEFCDPRVPVGREGRRARAAIQQDKKARLAQIRREYAELTGKLISDADTTEATEVDTIDFSVLNETVPEPDAAPAPLTAAEKRVAAKRASQSAQQARA
jgi:hypothetical protein